MGMVDGSPFSPRKKPLGVGTLWLDRLLLKLSIDLPKGGLRKTMENTVVFGGCCIRIVSYAIIITRIR